MERAIDTVMDWCAMVGFVAFIVYGVALHYDLHNPWLFYLFMLTFVPLTIHIYYLMHLRQTGHGHPTARGFLLAISIPFGLMIASVLMMMMNLTLFMAR